MAQPNQLEHRYLDTVSLGWKTLNSPTSTDPVWQDGANAMVNPSGKLVQRPGFSSVSIPGTFTGTIKRIFWWHTFAGVYYGMVCTMDSTQSYVYKYQSGTDAAAQLIWTSASTTPFDFVFSNNTCYFGNGVDMKKYEGAGTTVYNWGITRPAAAPTWVNAAGTLSSYGGGFYYFYTYVRSSNNHESSPSDPSVCTGNATAQKYTVTVTYSADPQVDKIYLYRSTDGGGNSASTARLVTTIDNVVGVGTTTYVDQTDDTALGSRVAPIELRNDPPAPCKGFVTHAGRIAGFLNDRLFYSGFEEISLNGGVPEECWPGNSVLSTQRIGDANSRPYPGQINALSAVADGILVYLSGDIHKIEGDSLDTFRYYKYSSHQGAKHVQAADTFGGLSVWMDTASAVWLAGGNELSLDIREDMALLDATTSPVVIHMQNKYRWVVVGDLTGNRLLVFDTDMQKWFVPWTFSASISALASCETAAGVVDLLIALDGQIVKMTPSTYTDYYGGGQNTLLSFVVTNLFDIVPAPAQRAGEQVIGSNISENGNVERIILERNAVSLSDCKIVVDDDNDNDSAFHSIFANRADPTNRTQGVMLQEDHFPCWSDTNVRAGRRAGLRLEWTAAGWALYSLAIAFKRARL